MLAYVLLVQLLLLNVVIIKDKSGVTDSLRMINYLLSVSDFDQYVLVLDLFRHRHFNFFSFLVIVMGVGSLYRLHKCYHQVWILIGQNGYFFLIAGNNTWHYCFYSNSSFTGTHRWFMLTEQEGVFQNPEDVLFWSMEGVNLVITIDRSVIKVK